jgi:hypothetical protein
MVPRRETMNGLQSPPSVPIAAVTPRRRVTTFDVVLRLLYVISTAVVLWLVVDGLAYYRTPLADRPHQDAYRLLRPAGMRGHTLGVIGSAMLILLLGYSLRKRSRRLARYGSISRWLSVHIYLGIFGPLLVTLHTSFKITGLVAVSYWSMVTVAVSGVFGRYLYRQIPRNLVGEEKTARELVLEREALDRAMTAEFPFGPAVIAALEGLAGTDPDGTHGRRAALRFLLRRDGRLRHDATELAARFARENALGADASARLASLARERAVLHRRSALLAGLQQLFHYWHVFHKPFAYLMLIIMVVHVVVAVATGYTWIF